MVRRNDKPGLPDVRYDSLPQPPRFIEHDELTQRGTSQRLFKRSRDPAPQGRLSREEEVLLFKRMQYCAYRSSRMWDRVERLGEEHRARYLEWYQQYMDIRERIVNGNMGLVFDMLGKNRFKNVPFDDLRSEGLMALVRAVDTFNPWSGYRFSTYACNAILHSFSRLALLESKRSHLWASSYDPLMEPGDHMEQHRQDHIGLLSERLNAIMDSDSSALSDHEKFVLKERFPLQPDKKKATLKKVGDAMKISKERVRQIQESALSKLRRLLLSDSVLR